MNVLLPSPLPLPDRMLLRMAVIFVPPAEQAEWWRGWQAELWHRRHPRSGRSHSAVDLYAGVLGDCFWLRTNAWRRTLSGTALLCVTLLGFALLVSILPLWTWFGSLWQLKVFAASSVVRFACEASLVTLVSCAVSSQTVAEGAGGKRLPRGMAHLFQAVKILLLLLTSFVISEDITQPFHAAHRFAAEVIQAQLFVLMAVVSLRWSFEDQKSRCKRCLRSLAAPARVGRPSWNFLESNGTELLCKDGHGLLSVPEIETSWRRSSHWIAT